MLWYALNFNRWPTNGRASVVLPNGRPSMHCPKLSCLGSCQAHPGPVPSRSQLLATFPLSAQCVSGSAAFVQFLRIQIRQTAGIFKFFGNLVHICDKWLSAQFGVNVSIAEAQFPTFVDTGVNSSNSWY